jgi:DMSO/TMAO reductase YedYZ heme-binding membrane subunit
MSTSNPLRNIRFWILSTSIVVAALVWIGNTAPGEPVPYGVLVRTYALLAVGYLYVTLLISPVIELFPKIPYKGQLVKARRALGVSAFLFAELHANMAFFKQLGGPAGLQYLNTSYLVAVIAGFLALMIVLLLALTSFDFAMRKLGRNWKRLHQLVYVAGVLILFHALSIGTHFMNERTPTARFGLMLVMLLFILQALRVDRKWRSQASRVGIVTVLVTGVSLYSLGALTSPGASGVSIHGRHSAGANTPVVLGDATKRFTVSMDVSPTRPQLGKEARLAFKVFDASTGFRQDRFTRFYGQFMHIVVVNGSLTEFAHVHPTTEAGGFVLNHTFPKAGRYHIYLNYAPYQAVEQQAAFTVQVGDSDEVEVASELAQDTATMRQATGYTAYVSAEENLTAAAFTAGTQPLSFSIQRDGQPVTTLQPYLEAFGHLSLVNIHTYEFVHAHPPDTALPAPGDLSGPDVLFVPMVLQGAVKPGTYRAFAEFSPNGDYIVVPFTIRIQ